MARVKAKDRNKCVTYDLLAWSQGRYARQCAQTAAANPYPLMSRMYLAWVMGWADSYNGPGWRRKAAIPTLWFSASESWKKLVLVKQRGSRKGTLKLSEYVGTGYEKGPAGSSHRGGV